MHARLLTVSFSIFVGRHLFLTRHDDPVDESTLESDAPDVLLDQARNAGDPFLAVTLYQKVLQARPHDTTVMGETADLMLHVGETAAAKEVWL